MKDAIQSELDFYTDLRYNSFNSTRFRDNGVSSDAKEASMENIYNIKMNTNEFEENGGKFSDKEKLVRNITYIRVQPDSVTGGLEGAIDAPANKGMECKSQERNRVEIGYMGYGSQKGEIDTYSSLFQSGTDRQRSRENSTQKNRDFTLRAYNPLIDRLGDAIQTDPRVGVDSRETDREFI
jgi:hypothetical protein